MVQADMSNVAHLREQIFGKLVSPIASTLPFRT